MQPGEILHYIAIEFLTGLRRGSNDWRAVIRKWKRQEFDEHNRLYRPIPGVGYQLMIPDERAERAVRERKSALRKLRKTFGMLARTEESLLSDRMRALRAEELKLLGPLAEVAGAGRRGAVLLSRKLAKRRVRKKKALKLKKVVA